MWHSYRCMEHTIEAQVASFAGQRRHLPTGPAADKQRVRKSLLPVSEAEVMLRRRRHEQLDWEQP